MDARGGVDPKELMRQADWQRPQALTNLQPLPRPAVPAADRKANISCSAPTEHKEADREWAALTTWLRMNLHHVSCQSWNDMHADTLFDFNSPHGCRGFTSDQAFDGC